MEWAEGEGDLDQCAAPVCRPPIFSPSLPIFLVLLSPPSTKIPQSEDQVREADSLVSLMWQVPCICAWVE